MQEPEQNVAGPVDDQPDGVRILGERVRARREALGMSQIEVWNAGGRRTAPRRRSRQVEAPPSPELNATMPATSTRPTTTRTPR